MSAPPVVCLHGFAGHAESWDTIKALLGGRRVEALTLFGHDPEHRPPGPVAFEDEVARVADFIRAIGEPVRICGCSMGGRITLGLLRRIPEAIASAILVGANPGLTSDADREQRIAGDQVWVRVLEDEGMETFITKWQAQGLFATQARLPADRLAPQRAIRLRHDARGLALSMYSLSLGRMPSYWDVLASTDVPVDIVVGALDEKFSALAQRMKERMKPGRGRVLRVADTGHNVVLEQPELLAAIIAGKELPPGVVDA